MQYILLIYGVEPTGQPTPEEMQAEIAEYNAYGDMLKSRNAMVSGEALHPVATAKCVRVRNSQTNTTDGPFAETKEQLGGYYVVNAKDLNEAIEFASKIPAAKNGTIEVREIIDFSQY